MVKLAVVAHILAASILGGPSTQVAGAGHQAGGIVSISGGITKPNLPPPAGGSWTTLTNLPPTFVGVPLLLTDGTIICQVAETNQWYKLTPDINGSYQNGTWSAIANMASNYQPLYFASAVLPDGRVVVMGGEYNGASSTPQDPVWTNLGSIYDPAANTWTALPAPSGWGQIGDAQCVISPSGTLILADPMNTAMASFNTSTLTWSLVGSSNKQDRFDEEGWALLPNGTILTVDALNAPASETFNFTNLTWSGAGSTINSLEDANSEEIGPMVLRPNGTVFAMGATGFNSVYNTATGTWSAAPKFPSISAGQLDIADGPACLLPDGNVFCVASPGIFNTPCDFFEWDGTNLTQVGSAPNAVNDSSYICNLLTLPTGQVLFTDFSNEVEIYTPTNGTYSASWQPTISSVASTIQQTSKNNVLQGTQLNGLSQCNAYGDDSTNASNYPLVRIQNNATGHVFYCKTHTHSTMGVATGSATVSTQFDVPSTVEIGPSMLYVVANGIPSAGQAVNTVAPNIVLPTSESLFRGTAVSGSVSNLFYSDSSYLQTSIGPVLNSAEAPVQVLVNGTSPTMSPSTFTLTVKGHSSSSNVSQTVYLYNYSTSTWVSVGTLALTTSDQSVTYSAPSGLSQFVNQSTGAIQAKVAATQTGPTLQSHWQTYLDTINWTIH